MAEFHIVVADAADFAARAALEISNRLRAVLAKQERATLALAGGETPRPVYRVLAESLQGTEMVEWERVEFFWSDERLVPSEDFRSNVGMARRYLLEPLGIRGEAIHSPGPADGAAAAAATYEQEVLRVLGTVGDSAEGPPRFDLILLGLGADGHIASLFPGAPRAPGCWVVPARAPEPPHERISFSLQLLASARSIVMLVSGTEKAETVRRVIEDRDPSLPAAHLPPEAVCWILDRPAAERL